MLPPTPSAIDHDADAFLVRAHECRTRKDVRLVGQPISYVPSQSLIKTNTWYTPGLHTLTDVNQGHVGSTYHRCRAGTESPGLKRAFLQASRAAMSCSIDVIHRSYSVRHSAPVRPCSSLSRQAPGAPVGRPVRGSHAGRAQPLREDERGHRGRAEAPAQGFAGAGRPVQPKVSNGERAAQRLNGIGRGKQLEYNGRDKTKSAGGACQGSVFSLCTAECFRITNSRGGAEGMERGRGFESG